MRLVSSCVDYSICVVCRLCSLCHVLIMWFVWCVDYVVCVVYRLCGLCGVLIMRFGWCVDWPPLLWASWQLQVCMSIACYCLTGFPLSLCKKSLPFPLAICLLTLLWLPVQNTGLCSWENPTHQLLLTQKDGLQRECLSSQANCKLSRGQEPQAALKGSCDLFKCLCCQKQPCASIFVYPERGSYPQT